MRTVTACAALLAAAALTITGCSAEHSQAPTAKPTASPTSKAATPTPPTPTPTALTLAQAGERYLALVCPSNRALAAVDPAYQAQNLDAIHAAAAPARDAKQVEALAFENPTEMWPVEIQADLKVLATSDYGTVGVLDRMVHAQSLDEANMVTFADDGAQTSAQRIRAKLGLSADTTASCAGR